MCFGYLRVGHVSIKLRATVIFAGITTQSPLHEEHVQGVNSEALAALAA